MKQVTFKGTPVKLMAPFIEVGATAPDFKLTKTDLSSFTLADGKGKFLVLNIFPSLDTGVCAASVRAFNKAAAALPNTLVCAVSKDLPFAHARFCTVEGIENVIPLSDYKGCGCGCGCGCDFSKSYGVLMEDGPLAALFARAVVIINPEGKVIYTELVPEIVQEPNYDAAIAAIK